MRRRSITALLVVLSYPVLILAAPMADRLILFPTTYSINPGGAVRKAVLFEKGEVELWTAKSQAAHRRGRAETFVLRFYGNADRAERWVTAEADAWGDRAVEVWGMNYPGFGGSTGPARLVRIGPAALAAFDALKQEAGDRPIVPFGASLGTAAALHVAAQRPVAGLVLHNPPALRQMILGQFGWWNLWLLAGPVAAKVPADLDNIGNAKRARTRAIFLLAENDDVVAPRWQKLVVDAYAGEKRVITLRGAHHNSPIEGAAIADLHNALEWLLPKEN
jgi:pimeloyl-ACP methyl ester carboxylesterase